MNTPNLTPTRGASKRGSTAQAAPGLPSEGYVRQAQLVPKIVPFSSATLWRRVKDGSFPAPFKLSPGVTAWRVEDVRCWLDAKSAANDEGNPSDATPFKRQALHAQAGA